MTRLENFYKEQVMPEAHRAFWLPERDAGSPHHQDHAEHGRGRSRGQQESARECRGGYDQDSGQKPITTKARVSVASFKIRDGWPIGCKVTLRRAQMWEFLDRLINISLPRVRDFRGVSGRAFDGRGNYNFGIKEQIIFPEIDFDSGRRDARYGYLHHHHRQDRRRSQSAAGSLQLPVPQLIDAREPMAKTSMVNRDIKRTKLARSSPPSAPN